jgi:Gas vesicle synthesis protein GvpL/GvpF
VILAYCVLETSAQPSATPAGAGGAIVKSIAEGSIACAYSETLAEFRRNADSLRSAALEFHRVIQALAKNATVIPFRFPTLMSDVSELRRHLEAERAHYTGALQRLQGMVQIEVRIRLRDAPDRSVPSGSGRAYLEARQARSRALNDAANLLRDAAGQSVREWRSDESAGAMRLYALLAWADAAAVQNSAASVTLPEAVEAVVSGPWPPSRFV